MVTIISSPQSEIPSFLIPSFKDDSTTSIHISSPFFCFMRDCLCASQPSLNNTKSRLTMVLPLAAAAARRNVVTRFAKQQVQKRQMGGGHGPAKEWEGIDKVVRGYFPEDHQLAMAIMGGYGGLFVLFKIKGAIGGKKVVEEVVTTTSSSPVVATTGIPPVDSPEFDKYLETDAFYKMLDSDDQLGKVVEDMK